MQLIDADALNLVHFRDSDGELAFYAQELLEAPTIDAVEVCRCRDCKHSGEFRNWWGKGYTGCCHYPEEIHSVAPEHFCAYGERRGDG